MKIKNRYIEFDILRILACFFVIVIHAAVFDQADNYAQQSFDRQAIYFWGIIARWAVPAFVMLSGMLILPKADETSIKRLMIHRVLRMLIVYVAWSCVYSAFNVFVMKNNYAGSTIKTLFDGCFSGELHMWYLPMIAGLYLISPLLAILLKNISKKWLIFWLSVMFIFSSLFPLIEKFDINIISKIISTINGYMDVRFLCGWTFYFVLGYVIKNHNFSKKEIRIVQILFVVGLLFTFFFTIGYSLLFGYPFGVLPYEYPNIVFVSVGVFVFFKEKVSKINVGERLSKGIVAVSNLTFGIYLIHVLILKSLYLLGVNIAFCTTAISVPIVSLAAFVISAIIIWLFRKIPVVGKYLA